MTRLSLIVGLAAGFVALRAQPCESQYSIEKVFSVPYGSAPGQVTIRREPDGTYGPSSFAVSEDIIFILDSEGARVELFTRDGRFVMQVPTAPLPVDIHVADDRMYVLDGGNGLSVVDVPSAAVVGSYRVARADGVPQVRIAGVTESGIELLDARGDRSTVPLGAHGAASLRLGGPRTEAYDAVRMSSSQALIRAREPSGAMSALFSFREESQRLASVDILGTDSLGHLFINEEVFKTEVPCRVDRFVVKCTGKGEIVAKIRLPNIYYCELGRDIRVAPNGDVYHLLADSSGVGIVRWRSTPSTGPGAPPCYPREYEREYHYNDNNAAGDEFRGEATSPSPQLLAVNRDEALQIAGTYVRHTWNCEARNLTNGIVIDPNGKRVHTPDWITVGMNVKVPYQWGGFSTIPEFDAGLLGGKYAGDDVCTGSGSPLAVGVDCSGFVSRCWKLSSHYSTYMMPAILIPLASWSDLKPGDAIHRIGHVRMYVANNLTGTVYVVESSGKDWRVSYRQYSYTNLTDYAPYRYREMHDAPSASVPDVTPLASGYRLHQNHPNPFNPSTEVTFAVPHVTHVRISVYDTFGRLVRVLTDGEFSSGAHGLRWDGTNEHGVAVASGTYFCMMAAEGLILAKEMVVVR
ncbi:MAG: hypothetical protein COS95_01080 [Ignavibacteriales bacterium CG07_land_8_20_14_0_80_59_12]|nr:MAG: hypothetical protein COS95_01080 [Ignavibacteriales bacterium CG07_land_8_20_14_0_80_59_12]